MSSLTRHVQHLLIESDTKKKFTARQIASINIAILNAGIANKTKKTAKYTKLAYLRVVYCTNLILKTLYQLQQNPLKLTLCCNFCEKN